MKGDKRAQAYASAQNEGYLGDDDRGVQGLREVSELEGANPAIAVTQEAALPAEPISTPIAVTPAKVAMKAPPPKVPESVEHNERLKRENEEREALSEHIKVAQDERMEQVKKDNAELKALKKDIEIQIYNDRIKAEQLEKKEFAGRWETYVGKGGLKQRAPSTRNDELQRTEGGRPFRRVLDQVAAFAAIEGDGSK